MSRNILVKANGAGSILSRELANFRGALLGIGIFSAVMNLLALTGSIFMLQVYDRVLPSKSVPTLFGLVIVMMGLYFVLAILDLIRTRILVRIGSKFDAAVTGSIYSSVLRLPLRVPRGSEGLQPIRDLDAVRAFLTGAGPGALFDLPWMPVYLTLCFAFHFYIGLTATIGALIIVALTVLTEALSREPVREIALLGSKRVAFAETSRKNSEIIHALGMGVKFRERWANANGSFIQAQQRAADVTGGFGSVIKVLRLFLQSAVLAVGAYLVIQQQATAGVIIASSIITGRALAPVDIAIANWRGFVAARQGWKRLSLLLQFVPESKEALQLPGPSETLRLEKVSVTPPGSPRAVVSEVTFTLKGGQALGIIGPSASGKTSLVKSILGIWPCASGSVRIDGADIAQWSSDRLGRYVGYLPQDAALFGGTVAENIARFDQNFLPDAVIAAAKAAGVHELILNLPNGYETMIGESGEALSAGQRQRIALARALYGDPFLVVLDEPNSNLDIEGEIALTKSIQAVSKRGGITVVIAHRPSALQAVDLVLALANGAPVKFGKRDEVFTPASTFSRRVSSSAVDVQSRDVA